MTEEEKRRRLRYLQLKKKKAQANYGILSGAQVVPPKNDPNTPTLGEVLLGAGDAALTIGASALGYPAAGYRGLYNLATEEDDPLAKAVKKIEETSSMLYSPKTEVGRQALEAVAAPFELLTEGGEAVGEITLKATGSPAAATAAQMLVETGPEMLGGLRVRPKQTRDSIANMKLAEQEFGIDMNMPDSVRTDQIQDAAADITGNLGHRGESMETVELSVKDKERASKRHRNAIYKKARKGDAYVESEGLQQLGQIMVDTMEDYKPKIRKLASDRLAEFKTLTQKKNVNLKEFDDWRSSLDKKELSAMKAMADDYMDAMFMSRMIKGTPEALNDWKSARKAHSEYMKTFKEDDVIRKITEMELTPEETRRLIFGMSKVYQPKSAKVVRKLKDILGEDSPEFTALRQDAALNIIEPLLGDTPNFKQFAKDYDALVNKNNSMLKVLFPEVRQRKAMEGLRNIAKGSDGITTKDFKDKLSLSRLGAVALFGHGIARRAMQVNLAQKIFTMLGDPLKGSNRTKIMAEALGYDASRPIITSGTVAIPAFGEMLEDLEEQE